MRRELTPFQKGLLKDAALLGIALAAQRWLNSTIAHVRGERGEAREKLVVAEEECDRLRTILGMYRDAAHLLQSINRSQRQEIATLLREVVGVIEEMHEHLRAQPPAESRNRVLERASAALQRIEAHRSRWSEVPE